MTSRSPEKSSPSGPPSTVTLDQRRASFAWDHAQRVSGTNPSKEFRNLAKGAPALIMGSGLMAALAYFESRTGERATAARQINAAIVGWLEQRFSPHPPAAPRPGSSSASAVPSATFHSTMKMLLASDAPAYMQATEEVLSMLGWLRQFADALVEGDLDDRATRGR